MYRGQWDAGQRLYENMEIVSVSDLNADIESYDHLDTTDDEDSVAGDAELVHPGTLDPSEPAAD